MATENYSNYDPKKIASADNMRFGLVIAEFNLNITEKLTQGAIETLMKHGCKKENIHKIFVPGSFELPLGAQALLTKRPELDAIICIGCVIQGETRHFDFVCQGATQGVQKVQLKFNKPIAFCLLTDNNKKQSLDRAGGSKGNKGVEAAIAAIKMAHLQKTI